MLGDHVVVSLSKIASIRTGAEDYEGEYGWTYPVELVFQEGRPGPRRLWCFKRQDEARGFAGRVAGFLGVSVVESKEFDDEDDLVVVYDGTLADDVRCL